MKKYVVISTNENPDYLEYAKYVTLAWNKLGWNVLCFTRNAKLDLGKENIVFDLIGYSKYRDETIVQCCRLFASCILKDAFIMTSDVDMIPLCNYWNPAQDRITCYGHDLTGYGHYPICYIAMTDENWRKIMGVEYDENIPLLRKIENVLDLYPQAISDDWNKWWQVDQDIITEKLKGVDLDSVLRGHDSRFGLPMGRIDRHNWVGTFDGIDNGIDAHMPRPFSIEAIDNIFKKFYNE